MLLRFSAFLGIALPLIVGAVALAGVSTDLRGVVVVAGLLGVPVVVVSAWSLVADWAGGYAAATQSEAANYQLNDAYTDLAGHPPADEGEFRQRFQLIRAQDNAQRDRDLLAVSKLYSSKTVQCDSAGCYSFDTANLS